MIIESLAFKALAADKELNSLMDSIRGKSFPQPFNQGIFTYDIPENPTSYRKKELAPLVRINPIYESQYEYADDEVIAEEQRVTVDFWCASASQSDKLSERIDVVLKEAGFERYTANEKPRYKDPDIDLIMNVRKYRVFDWKK